MLEKNVTQMFIGLRDPWILQTRKQARMVASFNQWLAQVNALLYDSYGFNIGDLPDEPFQDNYWVGVTPQEMVTEMKRNNLELVILE